MTFYLINGIIIINFNNVDFVEKIILNQFICKVEVMKTWLHQNKKLIPLEDLFLTALELEHRAVSLKASNVFPITYSLLANVSELLHTE